MLLSWLEISFHCNAADVVVRIASVLCCCCRRNRWLGRCQLSKGRSCRRFVVEWANFGLNRCFRLQAWQYIMPWKEFNDTTLLEIDCHKNWEYYRLRIITGVLMKSLLSLSKLTSMNSWLEKIVLIADETWCSCLLNLMCRLARINQVAAQLERGCYIVLMTQAINPDYL